MFEFITKNIRWSWICRLDSRLFGATIQYSQTSLWSYLFIYCQGNNARSTFWPQIDPNAANDSETLLALWLCFPLWWLKHFAFSSVLGRHDWCCSAPLEATPKPKPKSESKARRGKKTQILPMLQLWPVFLFLFVYIGWSTPGFAEKSPRARSPA